MMTDHQHVEMLVDGIDGERPRGICGGGQHVGLPANAQNVRRVPAARALGVEGVDGAALERRQRVLDKAGLVERVGVDGHLHVELVGHTKASVDGRGRGAPILVQLQAHCTGEHLFAQWPRRGAVALAEKAEVHRVFLGGLEHAVQVPDSRCAGGGVGAGGRAGAAAGHCRDAAGNGLVHQLRADEMDVAVNAAGGDDGTLGRNHLGGRADGHGVFLAGGGVRVGRAEAGLDAGISRVTDADDAAVLDAEVGLDDAEHGVENRSVGHEHIKRLGVRRLRILPHSVADDLAAAELDLVAIAAALGDEVALHLHEQVRVAEAHLVAGGGAEHLGVLLA